MADAGKVGSVKSIEVIAGDSALLTFLRPLQPYLSDVTITELCINRPGEIYIERRSGWTRYELPALTYLHCQQLAKLIATRSVQKLDDRDNLLSASLPGGERVQVVLPPSCEPGTVSLTIRKPTRLAKTLEEFESDGAFAQCVDAGQDLDAAENELLELKQAGRWREFISLAVKSYKNIIISGATGSGKTTFTRAIIGEIPTDERLITIEDTPELPLPRHPNHVHLFYSKDGQGATSTTPKKLLESCLRMKPTRILLAELRGDEAYYFLRNVNSGHPGSITTIHANSPRLAFEQLGLLIKDSSAGSTLSREDIKSLLYMLVDVIVQFKNIDGQRVVTKVYFDPLRKRSGIANS
jgi:type IV secretion system protein VirB11